MVSRQKAEGRRQKAEGRRQKAEGRRQKAEGRRQKAQRTKHNALFSDFRLLPSALCFLLSAFCFLLTAFCLLPSAYCFLPSDPHRRLAFPNNASRLKMPEPREAMYRNTKQYNTASSPLFSIGQNPAGECRVKYATAIWPLAMKAA